MPGVIVHTLLATRVLDRWAADPAGAPFAAGSPDLRAAFLAGCMGPDAGLYPGGDPLTSDLAHYVRTGELARTIVAEARTGAEQAYAWGWFSHVLADVLIHPLVNAGAGEAAGAGGPLTYVQNRGLHVAVETGIDGAFFARWRELGLAPLPPADPQLADLLGRAYHAVYGPAVGVAALRATLAAWGRWNGVAVSLSAAAGRSACGGWSFALLYRLCRAASGVFARGGVVHGFTHPLAPSAGVAARVERVVEEYPDRFREHYRDGLRSLPDYNLDTGEVESAAAYPLTTRTVARLGRAVASAGR